MIIFYEDWMSNGCKSTQLRSNASVKLTANAIHFRRIRQKQKFGMVWLSMIIKYFH